MDRRGGTLVGAGLVGLGLLLLAERVLDVNVGRYGWPFIVVGIGVLLIVGSVAIGGTEGSGMAVGGGITTVVGLVLAVQNATGLWATWAYAWTLVGPGGSGLGLLVYGIARGMPDLREAGIRSIGAALGLFALFGLFFEGIIGLSGEPFLTGDAVPFALIGIGAVVLVAGFFRRPTAPAGTAERPEPGNGPA